MFRWCKNLRGHLDLSQGSTEEPQPLSIGPIGSLGSYVDMIPWSQTHTQQWILRLYSPLGSFKWFLEMCGEAECAIAAAVTSTIHKCTKFTWVLLKWMVTPLLEIEMGQFGNTVFVRFGLHSWLKGRSKQGLPHHTKFPFSCSDFI